MFDTLLRPWIDPPLNRLGKLVASRGVGADTVTVTGLALGLACAATLALGAPPWFSLGLLALGRLADGLDGAVARAGRKTDYGGYLDIFCDFIFYAAVPLAMVLRDPAENAVAGAFLIASFYINAASFLGFAAIAGKRGMETTKQGQKSLYYAQGLLEGAETIAFFAFLCLFPQHFAPAAWVFGGLCLVTAVARVVLARGVFHHP